MAQFLISDDESCRDPVLAGMDFDASQSKVIFDIFGDDLELQDALPDFQSQAFKHIDEQIMGSPDMVAFPPLVDNGDMFLKPDDATTANKSPFEASMTPNTSIGSMHSFSGSAKQTKIPAPDRVFLDAWLEKNKADPYLKSGDAEALAHLTCLQAHQVQVYMRNARARRRTADAPLLTPSMTSVPSLSVNVSSPMLHQPRRDRRISSAVSLQSVSSPSTTKRYRCFSSSCYATFGRKSDFKRHMETVHFPQEKWTCLLAYPASSPELDPTLTECHFCDFCSSSTDVTATQLEEHLVYAHNYRVCLEKPESERSFARKDKLKQHVQQVHAQQGALTSWQRTWVQPINQDVVHDCHLCDSKSMAWPRFFDHVVWHYETEPDANEAVDGSNISPLANQEEFDSFMMLL